jgi:hypothetical protein
LKNSNEEVKAEGNAVEHRNATAVKSGIFVLSCVLSGSHISTYLGFERRSEDDASKENCQGGNKQKVSEQGYKRFEESHVGNK